MATSRLVAGVHMLLCRDRAGTVHRPCRECAGTDRAGTVHQVFIVQGPCRDRAWSVLLLLHGPCRDRASSVHCAGTVQGP